jgi:outer membrane protein assembly factor BamB
MALALFLLGSGDAVALPEEASTSECTTVWKISEAEGLQNRFREILGGEAEFPMEWCRFSTASSDQVFFLDDDGEADWRFDLDAEESVMVSQDGSTHLVWSKDPANPALHVLAYFRRGKEVPEWSAPARGEPVLLSRDGSVFVLAHLREEGARFGAVEAPGDLQVVGSGGEVLGDLPIYPIACNFTSGGERVLLLHEQELMVLTRQGRVDWQTRVPIDNLASRLGMHQLATGPGIVVVAGTGHHPRGSRATPLTPGRLGVLQAYSESGKLLWQHEQSPEEDLWFQITAAVSPDGSRVTTCHSTSKALGVRQYDATTGELLWERTARRGSGFRSLSMSQELTVLAHSEVQTHAVAWDNEGNLVWDGIILLSARLPKIREGNLLVGEHWVVRLDLEPGS